ncbi:MAG: amidohydrolase family protein [Planctomycetales bacterium]|nr:amidohydrolase family protein [Planctomycetales bacterium]
MTTFTLRARWVVPVVAPPIEGGCVAVSDGRIVAVGGPDAARGPVEDLGDVALLPGLVNAHCHLEFSSLSQPLGEAGWPLPAWIERVIADRKRADRNATTAVAAGLAESLRAGVTTVGDIATAQPAAYATAGPRPRLVLLHEAIGFSDARRHSAFADVVRRAESAPSDGCATLASGASPHAPYTVHPELVSQLTDWAAQASAPLAMHLAESPEEIELLAAGSGAFRELLEARSMFDPAAIPAGTRPLDYLRRLTAAPRALVIHGNYLDATERNYLAEHADRLSLVHCPRTHAYFDHPPLPLAEWRASGVRIALGTDSRASNPDLDLWREMQTVLAKHPAVRPADAVAMVTATAAEALGVSDQTGSLAPGRWADILAVPCASPSDPLDAVVAARGPSEVWLGGRRVSR